MSFEHPHWLNWVPPEAEPEAPYPSRWLALLVISLAIMLIGVDVSITGVAAPSMSSELHATIADIQWVFDGFTLALGGFVLLGGGLADRFGRKGIFQLGMVVFALGSLVAAFATTPNIVIGGRVITGLGAALVMPAALAMVGVIFPPDERPTAIGIWAAVASIGIALGPVIGGVLLQQFWFGSVFLINVPVCMIGIIGAALFVPTSRRPGEVPLDIWGAVLSVVALTGVVGGIIEAPNRGFTDPIVIGALVLGGLAAVVFVRWELQNDQGLFDVRVFRISRVVAGALAVFIVYVTFNGTTELLIPQYLEYVEGYDDLVTGLLMLPVGVVFGLASAVSARMTRRYGERRIFLFALTLMVAGLGLYSLLALWGGYANVLVGTIVFFIGVGTLVAPATATIMDALPIEKAGDGSATNQLARQVGGALGVAISGSIYAVIYSRRLAQADLPLSPQQLMTAQSSVSGALDVASQLPQDVGNALATAAADATAIGMSWAFLISAVATFAVLVIAGRVLRRRSVAQMSP
jgi:EmrB/QacA subfamily drug resistance transporter